MIKRLFYRLEHGDRDDASASSSSESELDAEAINESDDDDDDSVELVEDDAGSTSSGSQSEDGSEDEVAVESPGAPEDEAGNETEDDQKLLTDSTLLDMHTAQSEEQQVSDEESIPVDLPEFILKCKSVYKCRICPKVVCLSEETLTAHLKSKRHARSEKQMKEGRLKAMLNNDGEIENQDPDETPEQDVAPPQDKPKQKKRGRRFLRQHKGKFRKKRREED